MNKKAIFGVVFTLGLAFGGLNSNVSAIEIQPRGEIDNTVGDCAQGYVMSTEGTCVTPEEAENILEEGTADEPLVVCADESEPDCDTSDTNPEIVEEGGEEEEVEPALWPFVLSVSALGVTALLIIIINLLGRKKK